MKSTKDSLLEDIKAEFAEVNAMMEALEAKEPEDEASEAYDKWIEECEQLAIESESLMTLIDYKKKQGLKSDNLYKLYKNKPPDIDKLLYPCPFYKEQLQKNEIKYIKNCTNRVILYTLH